MKKCRVTKNEQPWHLLTIVADRGEGDFTLVGPPKRMYLSVHATHGSAHASISGRKTLVALAKAILAADQASK